MPRLVVMQAAMFVGVLGNMYVCSMGRVRVARNSSRGISIARGNIVAAFLKPNFFVRLLKSLLRSFSVKLSGSLM